MLNSWNLGPESTLRSDHLHHGLTVIGRRNRLYYTDWRKTWVDNKMRTHSITERAMQHYKNNGSLTRLEHPNTDEAEENVLKNNFREMFESLKED